MVQEINVKEKKDDDIIEEESVMKTHRQKEGIQQ